MTANKHFNSKENRSEDQELGRIRVKLLFDSTVITSAGIKNHK